MNRTAAQVLAQALRAAVQRLRSVPLPHEHRQDATTAIEAVEAVAGEMETLATVPTCQFQYNETSYCGAPAVASCYSAHAGSIDLCREHLLFYRQRLTWVREPESSGVAHGA